MSGSGEIRKNSGMFHMSIGSVRRQGALLSVAERSQDGRDLRKAVPRSQHATWSPPVNRADPVQVLIETDRDRIAELLPIRYHRMRQSPFTFLRGAATIMAADLAGTPASGIMVQACGDCHLANFGTFATPEGTPVFDINDFDETLPAPFEWDIKRLAASVVTDGRSRGMADKACRNLARIAVHGYRTEIAVLCRRDPLTAWYERIDIVAAFQGIEDLKLRDRELRRLQATTEAAHSGYPKLLHRQKGEWRIRAHSPLIFPLTERSDTTHEIAARAAFHSYEATLPEERRVLLRRYRLTDVAFKVVGIGSVGTFCAIGLYVTADGDRLMLQIKEAGHSALAHYVGSSAYTNQGERVVVGQRMMQASPDVFLGWTSDHGDDRHCYVRQLKDHRLALLGTELADAALPHYTALCGQVLARAHARSGDAARIAGYMGHGGTFDAAISDFALAYAKQTERDWRLFLEAIKSGLIEASTP
jgi:uncharacterized protein (DUF2252 family)